MKAEFWAIHDKEMVNFQAFGQQLGPIVAIAILGTSSTSRECFGAVVEGSDGENNLYKS